MQVGHEQRALLTRDLAAAQHSLAELESDYRGALVALAEAEAVAARVHELELAGMVMGSPTVSHQRAGRDACASSHPPPTRSDATSHRAAGGAVRGDADGGGSNHDDARAHRRLASMRR